MSLRSAPRATQESSCLASVNKPSSACTDMCDEPGSATVARMCPGGQSASPTPAPEGRGAAITSGGLGAAPPRWNCPRRCDEAAEEGPVRGLDAVM